MKQLTFEEANNLLDRIIPVIKERFIPDPKSPSGISYAQGGHAGTRVKKTGHQYTVCVCGLPIYTNHVLCVLGDIEGYRELKVEHLMGDSHRRVCFKDRTLAQPLVIDNLYLDIPKVSMEEQPHAYETPCDVIDWQAMSKSSIEHTLASLGIDVEVKGFNKNHPLMQ